MTLLWDDDVRMSTLHPGDSGAAWGQLWTLEPDGRGLQPWLLGPVCCVASGKSLNLSGLSYGKQGNDHVTPVALRV